MWSSASTDTQQPTLYSLLQLGSITASPEEIKAQFRKLALATHPDKAGGSANTAFSLIREAYQTLSDPIKRRAYDATLVQYLDMQEFLNRYQELVLTVQGLSLPLSPPSLHPAPAGVAPRQPQQQPQRRCHAHTHAHAHGHHLRQQLAARPPLLTWA